MVWLNMIKKEIISLILKIPRFMYIKKTMENCWLHRLCEFRKTDRRLTFIKTHRSIMKCL